MRQRLRRLLSRKRLGTPTMRSRLNKVRGKHSPDTLHSRGSTLLILRKHSLLMVYLNNLWVDSGSHPTVPLPVRQVGWTE